MVGQRGVSRGASCSLVTQGPANLHVAKKPWIMGVYTETGVVWGSQAVSRPGVQGGGAELVSGSPVGK